MVTSQTLHFRGSLSFFSLCFLLHCQGTVVGSVLKESSWKMLGQDTALSPNTLASRQVALQRWVAVSVSQSALPPQFGAHKKRAGQASLNCNMVSLLPP
jgi:hypothetical protein